MKMDRVYQDIKEQIIYGKIKPGTILTVDELAQQFKVSKTPVRDSLNAIKLEGLIEVIPYKGYRVTHIDVKTMQDLLQMRLILEGAAAESAAKHITPFWAKRLVELASPEIHSESQETFNIQYIRINYEFHTAIAQVSNQYLSQSIGNVLNLLQRVFVTELATGDLAEMNQTHLHLVELIRQGEGEAARKLVLIQLEASKNRILHNLWG